MYFGLIYYVISATNENIRMLLPINSEHRVVSTPANNEVPMQTFTPLPPPTPPASYPPPVPPASYPPMAPTSYPPTGPTAPYPPAPYLYPTTADPNNAPPQTMVQVGSLPATPYIPQASPYPPAQYNPQPPLAQVEYANQTPANTHERIPDSQEKLKLFRIFFKLVVFYVVTTLV